VAQWNGTTALENIKWLRGIYDFYIGTRRWKLKLKKSNDYPLNFKRMQVKTKAIVLSSIKFRKKAMVKCFTKSHGLKSYFVRDAFSGRKSIISNL
jgi:hypothetical protein